jgi:uncharacterized damage-inducible protein DinB
MVTIRLIEDMRTAPLVQPTPKGGNHPLWVLGHLTLAEGRIPQMLLGEENPADRWENVFNSGTQPTTDAGAYPPFDEVLAMYRKLRARSMELLEQFGDAGLEQAPKMVPPGMEDRLRTVADVFLIVGALHQSMHRGQVADARRVAGREPMFPGPGPIRKRG